MQSFGTEVDLPGAVSILFVSLNLKTERGNRSRK